MRGPRLGVPLPPLVREAGVDAAPVLGADRAGDETVGLETCDHTAERALREVDGVGELLDAPVLLVGRREPIEHLELAHAEPVLVLQRALERAHDARVTVDQVTPLVDDRSFLPGSHAAHYIGLLHKLRSHFLHMHFMHLHVLCTT